MLTSFDVCVWVCVCVCVSLSLSLSLSLCMGSESPEVEQIVKLEMLEQDGSASVRSQTLRDFSELLRGCLAGPAVVKRTLCGKDMDLERTVRTAAMSDLSAAVERPNCLAVSIVQPDAENCNVDCCCF